MDSNDELEIKYRPPEVIISEDMEDIISSNHMSENAYDKFKEWCDCQNAISYSENVLIEYFSDLANKYKWPYTELLSHYSMIKSMLYIKHNIDTTKFLKLQLYFDDLNEDSIPRKESRIFTRDNIEEFLSNAPDDKYLVMKVILIVGITGACRCEEMVKININDVVDVASHVTVRVRETKTNLYRSFNIVGELSINILRDYLAQRPEGMEHKRFFLRYDNGRCTRSVMGIHTIGAVPKLVAAFLKLPKSEKYTGHCLRRTSAAFSFNI